MTAVLAHAALHVALCAALGVAAGICLTHKPTRPGDGHTAKENDMSFADTNTPAARAARTVPQNPNPLCRDFTPQPEPAEFWCANCRWNEPMHADENERAAIAEALDRLPA